MNSAVASRLAGGIAARTLCISQKRGGVKDETHLVSGGAVTRHAVRLKLRLVQLDQVLHLAVAEQIEVSACALKISRALATIWASRAE
jgi:hypothetical protein